MKFLSSIKKGANWWLLGEKKNFNCQGLSRFGLLKTSMGWCYPSASITSKEHELEVAYERYNESM